MSLLGFRESNHSARGSPAKRTRPFLTPRIVALTSALLGLLATAEAQVITFAEINGKPVECLHTGLSSALRDCGARSYWYTYVFVGSISVITPVADGEDELKMVPEEVFYGNPGPLMSVLTSQAACLLKLVAGDRWLFFLREEHGKPIVLDYYGNDSSPVSSAGRQIETLRRLQSIGDFGILRGNVTQPNSSDGKPVPYARVRAVRAPDGKRFVSNTDADGRYEFQPLPPGDYAITVDPVGPFRADPSGAALSKGACWDLTLSRSPHAQLGGVVKRPDGSPVKADIVLISADNSWFETAQTNDRGYFSFDSVPAGNYVIGTNPPESPPAWRLSTGGGTGLTMPTASFYYPNAIDRSAALVIELASDQKRNDLNFVAR